MTNPHKEDPVARSMRILVLRERRFQAALGKSAGEIDAIANELATRLALAAWRARETYSPARGAAFASYAARCFKNEISNFRRAMRKAALRVQREVPIDAAPEEDAVPLARDLRDVAHTVELRDVAGLMDIFAQYHPFEAKLLAAYAAGLAPTAIARATGIAPATMLRTIWPRTLRLARRFFK